MSLPININTLMDNVAIPLLNSEGPELATKIRRRAEKNVAVGISGSGAALFTHIGVYFDHYKGLAAAVWSGMLRVLTEADVEAYPELGADLKQKFDLYLSAAAGRIRSYMADLRQRGNAMPTEPMAMNVTYNLTGSNPRVNINSQDYSINIDNAGEIFRQLSDAISDGITDERLRDEMLGKTKDLESALTDKPRFLRLYSEFIALAANHMTVIAPFIPVLTQWLGS